MSLLSLDGVVIRLGGRTLLDGADLVIARRQRVGLVGRNGAGKSTMLAAIAGEIAPDGGTIRLAAGARLGRVAQHAPSGAANLLDTVLAADTERLRLLAEADSAASTRLAEIHERLRVIAADAAPSRAAAILAGLGFDEAAQARSLDAFSGGWRMRVALAAALFAVPDLLLLDEPSNHLDLEAALWLESWLARFPGAAILVSHDRGLLDRAVHAIAHLERGRLTLTQGGLSAFLRQRAEQAEVEARAAARIAAERARIGAFVARFRASATKASQAQSRLKALARLPDIEVISAAAPARFAFPVPTRLAPPIITLERAAAGYDGRQVLRGLDLTVDTEDRIALLGPNGNGKSTLARLLAGRLAPLAGKVRRAPGLAVGYFAQAQEEELVAADTPIAHLARALPRATPTTLRAQLARFGLDADRAETRAADLSGGERARLLLALATRAAPHLLILDEPTNHLDIDARAALIKALAEFPGAVLLISHDPDLVEAVADRLWLVGDGTARPFDGDLDDYRALLAERARSPARPDAKAPRRQERRERAVARVATAPLRQAARDAEATLERLARERAVLQARLADPSLYEPGSGTAIAAANARLAAIRREEEAAEAVWLDAASALEDG